MDRICELKLSIFSAMHRIIDRVLYIEQAIEGLVGALSQAIPQSRVAIIIGNSTEIRFFFTPFPDESNREMEQRIHSL